jgi:hypothetical protein
MTHNYPDAPVISYSKSDLHLLYKGENNYPSYDTFRKWLEEIPGLDLTNRVFTPGQVAQIFLKHGRPLLTPEILNKIPSLKTYLNNGSN